MVTICGLGVGEAIGGISVVEIEVAVAVIVDCGVIVASCSKGNGEAGGVILANVDTFSLEQLIKRKLSNKIRMIVFITFTLKLCAEDEASLDFRTLNSERVSSNLLFGRENETTYRH